MFPTLVNNVLRDMLNHFVFVCIDDIHIFSQNMEEHIKHVRLVLQRLLENKHFVKAEKCESQVTTLGFLGFMMQPGQVRADAAKVQAVAEWPYPPLESSCSAFYDLPTVYPELQQGENSFYTTHLHCRTLSMDSRDQRGLHTKTPIHHCPGINSS